MVRVITDKDFFDNTEAFNTYMREIDARLRKEAIPIKARPLYAFRELAKDGLQMVMAGYLKDPRANCVFEWFHNYYGDKLLIEFTFGRVVLIIDGDPYVYKVPFIIGNWKGEVSVEKLLIGMTKHRFACLSDGERRKIDGEMSRFFQITGQLWNLPGEIKSHWEVAVNLLSTSPENYGLSKWESAQFAETLLKCYISTNGGNYPTGNSGHDLNKLYAIARSLNLGKILSHTILACSCSSNE